MVEEYDRLNTASGSKPGRLRLFLFPKSSSIKQLLVERSSTKSEDWFLDALNGKASNISGGVSDRGFSESSSVNCLLGLEDDFVGKEAVGGKDVEVQIETFPYAGNHLVIWVYLEFSVDDRPVKAHNEENQKVGELGIEEQIQRINFGVGGNVKQEEVGGFVATSVVAKTVVSAVPVIVGEEYVNWIFSEDEISDRGGNRETEQAEQQQVQIQL
ncbi:Hypothetical predicted protein [Olea europaea subsp. europaea]|uniref:Uncharacterized protein n=1 Tax=Olea europaea subsp. europaea TaxID=158383 RepID=A0A8S0PHM6_OLEEU|nr:Hypothetical predicted protein [Olea europaea subsp. europaea]